MWLGLSIGHAREDGTIPCFDQSDVELSDTLDALLDERLWAVLVMHTEIDDTAAALAMIRQRWPGPLGAYPHSGFIEFPHWHQEHVIEPAAFVDAARDWYAQGARLDRWVLWCRSCPHKRPFVRTYREPPTRRVQGDLGVRLHG